MAGRWALDGSGAGTRLILAGGLGLGVGVTVEVWNSPVAVDQRVATAASALIGGWGFLVAGVLTRRRASTHRIGTLMLLLAFAWLIGAAQLTDRHRLTVTVGALFGGLWAALLAHLTLAFPSGRLGRRRERAVVCTAYLVGVVGEWAWVLVAGRKNLYPNGCSWCSMPLVSVGRRPALASQIVALQGIGAALVAAAGCLVLLDHWRNGTLLQRRALAPVIGVGGLAGLLLGASFGLWAIGSRGFSLALRLPYGIALALVPFAFAAGVLRGRLLAAFAVTRFVNELNLLREPELVSKALASALGDEGLSVVYWLADRDCYVDGEGRALQPRGAGAGRVLTEVEFDGRLVAALLHDPLLLDDRQAVRAAGQAAALWLERARLEAERNARMIELQASRARLVQAADAERRRIERDLHDGAQARLAAILLQTKLRRRAAADPSEIDVLLDDLESGIGDALSELRALAAGILPPVLTDHGLSAALAELASRTPLPLVVCSDGVGRLPEPVEVAAYFVIAEALANVMKHARARHVSANVALREGLLVIEIVDDGIGGATIANGSGLRGLSDRVGALDGRLQFRSASGDGTVVHAEIPCEL